MKIISCQICGTMIDTDRLKEPEIYNEEGEVIESALWDSGQRKYVASMKCPCCRFMIRHDNGDVN